MNNVSLVVEQAWRDSTVYPVLSPRYQQEFQAGAEELVRMAERDCGGHWRRVNWRDYTGYWQKGSNPEVLERVAQLRAILGRSGIRPAEAGGVVKGVVRKTVDMLQCGVASMGQLDSYVAHSERYTSEGQEGRTYKSTQYAPANTVYTSLTNLPRNRARSRRIR